MDRIVVKLQQHTPILHFQSKQKGVTLRASEVKPRFDAYLREQGIPVPSYKMRIISRGETVVSDVDIPRPDGRGKKRVSPMFFGDNKMMVENADLTLEILVLQGVFNTAPLIAFFAQNNFGTRQTKGYGSYTVASIDGVRVEARDSFPRQYVSFFEMNEANPISVLKQIELLSKTLRGGINGKKIEGRPKPLYFKSLMFSYAKAWNCHWDKRNIKEHFCSPQEMVRQKNKYREKEPLSYAPEPIQDFPYQPGALYDFRDCLGFSTHESWSYYDMTISKRYNGGDFSRFKSPIVFKPIRTGSQQWRVYVLATEFPAEALDTPVMINGALELRIFPDFSVLDFLEFSFCDEDIMSHFDNVEGNEGRVRQITKMYSQLKTNFNKA